MTRETDQPPVAGNDAAAERRWYVEEGGAFVGPLERSALAQKWRTGEIGAATLVWAEGFAGWLPLGDVPELADVWGAPRDSTTPSFATADWAPVKAPGVNTLFRREVNPPPPRRAGEVRLGPPEFPAVVASEPSGWRGQLASLQRVTMTGLNKAWRSLHDAQRHSRRMTVVAVVATCCALVAGGALAYVLERRPAVGAGATNAAPAGAPGAAPVTPVVAATGVVAATVAAPAAGAAPATGPAPAIGPAPATGAATATGTARATGPAPDSREARPTAPVATPPPPRAPVPVAAPAPAPPADADDDDSDSEPVSPAGDAAPAPLDKAEMVAATKAQVATLGACIKEARRTGELQPQRYTFVLDWVIEPDGAVTSAALKGPPELLGTSVRPCFEAALARWRYRASAQATRVSNFPLSVTVP